MTAEKKLILVVCVLALWAAGEMLADLLYPADTIPLVVR